MKNYMCIARDGSNKIVSAYTDSDAYQQATDWSEEHGGLISMDEQ